MGWGLLVTMEGNLELSACTEPEKSVSGGPDLFLSQHLSQRAVWTSLEKQLDPTKGV